MDNMVANGRDSKDSKIKVTSAEIVVHGTAKKPYYEIKYQEIGSNHYNIGFSSCKLDFVFQWLKEYFDIVNTDAICDVADDEKTTIRKEFLLEVLDTLDALNIKAKNNAERHLLCLLIQEMNRNVYFED